MQKIIICIIITLFTSYTAVAATTKELKLSNGLTLVPQEEHLTSAASKYQVDIEYPALKGNKQNAVEQRLNQQINNTINNAITEFKVKVVENSASAITLPESVNKNSLQIYYKAIVLHAGKNHLLSLCFHSAIMIAGDAHPVHRVQVMNFNLEQGKELRWEDLFRTKSNYLDIISSYARSELVSKVKMDAPKSFDQGTAPVAENFQNWNLTADGILITFNENQVAAYVFGEPDVIIPYSMLHDVILSDSLIAICVTSNKDCLSEVS